MRQLLKEHGRAPRVLIADKLKSYAATNRDRGINVELRRHVGALAAPGCPAESFCETPYCSQPGAPHRDLRSGRGTALQAMRRRRLRSTLPHGEHSSVRRIRLQGGRTEALPSFDAFQRRWPNLQITRHRRERRVREQVEPALEAFASYALFNCGNEPAASPALIGPLQNCMLRGDRSIRSAQDIGSGREVDIAEQRENSSAENSNPDQRKLERPRT